MKKFKCINEQTWARMDSLNDIRNEVMGITTTKVIHNIFKGRDIDGGDLSKFTDIARSAVYETVRQLVDIIDEHLICIYDNAPTIVHQTESMTTAVRFLARTIISLQQAINFYKGDPNLYIYEHYLIDCRDAFIEELMEQDCVDWVDVSTLPHYLEFYTHDEDGETHYYSLHIISPKSDLEHRRMLSFYSSACAKLIDDIKTNGLEE